MNKVKEVFYKEYLYDFTVDGGATGDISLKACDPIGAALDEGTLITDVIVVNEAAITGSPTLKLGIGGDDDGLLQSFAAKVTSANTVCRAGEVDGDLIFDSTADAKKAYRVGASNNQPILNISSAAVTAGKLRFILELYRPSEAVGYEE